MASLSFTFQLGNPVVWKDYNFCIISSFPGIGNGPEAMWLIRDSVYFNGRPTWAREKDLRLMTPEDDPDDCASL